MDKKLTETEIRILELMFLGSAENLLVFYSDIANSSIEFNFTLNDENSI